MKEKMCQICGDGKLHVESEKNTVEYNGSTTELDTFFSVCDACGSEQSDGQQLRDSKRKMIAFKKYVDGLLSGSEVRSIRKRLNITQSEAAEVFGGGPTAFSKYETDDIIQAEAMDNLLRMASTPKGFRELQRIVDNKRAQHNQKVEPISIGAWKAVKVAKEKYPAIKVLQIDNINQGSDWADLRMRA